MMIGGEDEEGGSTGSSDEEDHEIPLPNVKTEVLAKVIEFCKHHSVEKMPDIDKPLKSSNMKDVVPAWDAAFVEVEQDMLFELILAANYMDIKSLLDLTCAKVASMIKGKLRHSIVSADVFLANLISSGKTPEEIRKTFNIVNDFTPEEEAQAREENKWCEEA